MHSISIKQFWRGVQRRAQWLNTLQRLCYMLSGFFLVTLAGAGGFSVMASVPALSYDIIAYSMVMLFVVVLVVQAWLWMRERRRWGETRAVAEFVEHRVPTLDERSFLALDEDRPDNFLHQRALQKASVVLQGIPLSTLLPNCAVKKSSQVLMFSLVLLGVGQWLFPVTPLSSLAALWSQDSLMTEQLKGATVDTEQAVVVGDLTITYIFPEYTGMESVQIQNSDGAIRAPQGTEIKVTARTLQQFQAVQLQVNQQPPELASLEFGRNIEANFTLAEEGQYRFLLFDGEIQQPSQPFELAFDDDDAPVVTLEVDKTSIPSNLPVKMKWNVRDDFGIERVLLEVEANGEVESFLLRKPERNRVEMGGQLKRSVESLGLKGGDVATLRMVAYDNHSASKESKNLQAEGLPYGKRGVSADVTIQIMTRQMTADEMVALNRKLRAVLIPILAAYLVEETPHLDNAYRWGLEARTRYDALRELTDSEWRDGWPTYLSAELVADLLMESGEMFRFVTTTFGPQRIGEPAAEDAALLSDSYTTHLANIERTIFLIDRMLRQVAFANVGEAAQGLDRNASRFAQTDFESMSAQQIVNRLSPLDESLEDIGEAVQELGGYSIKEFVEGRLIEVGNMEKVLRDSVVNNEATSPDLAGQFSMSVSQFSEGVQEMIERSKAEEEKLQEEMESLIEKLEELDARQQALATEMSEMRRTDPNAKQVADIWQQIQQKVSRAVELGQENEAMLKDGRSFRFGSIRSITQFSQELQGMYRSVIVRDQSEVALQLMLFERYQSRLSVVLENEASRSRQPSEPRPPELDQMSDNADDVRVLLDEVRRLLSDDAFELAESSPEMIAFSEKQSTMEAALAEDLSSLLPKITEVEQQIPTAKGDATRFAQQGVKTMEDATEVLKEGDDMAGESLELQASARIQDAIEALKQAAQEMQQMQQQSQQMMSGESSGESSDSMSSAELNPLEKNISPEEYRKLLLEGMQGDVPDEYQALKKKYYEELVAQ